MKHHPHWLGVFALLLLLLSTGCPAPDGLQIHQGDICLTEAGNNTCIADRNRVLWLHRDNNILRLESLRASLPQDFANYIQYGQATYLPIDNYTLTEAGGILTIAKGSLQISSDVEQGFLLMRDNNDKTYALSATVVGCPRIPIQATSTGFVRNGVNLGMAITEHTNVIQTDADGTTVLEHIVSYNFNASVTPGDTGTEVIIIDNFNPTGRNNSCCDTSYLSCAPEPGNSAGDDDDRDEAGKPGDGITHAGTGLTHVGGSGLTVYEAHSPITSGWEVKTSVRIERVCIWEECERLIVADTQSGTIWCFNTAVCTVMLYMNSSGGMVSALLPEGCDVAAAFQVCNPNDNDVADK